MKVISHGTEPGEYLIIASGREVTALEEAVYRRNIAMQEHEGRPTRDPHVQIMIGMLDALRRPFVARRS